ncbi:hypothetical protein FHX59_006452 [Paraburkholderia silvatlantica]|uniref:Integrase catalytic domain-containing protein n=1 Tax=Paraburkholderia silvatlantica TaxID=321895 RepID=A0ABR6FY32_9BURK|nr:hypothetical protein [Paraburkholderia silvatlantica]
MEKLHSVCHGSPGICPSTFSYFEALSKYLVAHGKPVAFYSDKASAFYVKGRSETAGKGVTQ